MSESILFVAAVIVLMLVVALVATGGVITTTTTHQKTNTNVDTVTTDEHVEALAQSITAAVPATITFVVTPTQAIELEGATYFCADLKTVPSLAVAAAGAPAFALPSFALPATSPNPFFTWAPADPLVLATGVQVTVTVDGCPGVALAGSATLNVQAKRRDVR
jgi:hypothetical protein